MEITHLGHASFKLRGRSVTLITDPYDSSMVGFKFPKTEADVITVSHQHADHNCTSAVGGTPLIISGPGEYEVKGVRIIGLSTFHDEVKGTKRGKNTVYRIIMDGISILHCGDLGHLLSDNEVDQLDGIDILIVPAGGVYTISTSEAVQLIAKLDPHIIIPMHYKTALLSPLAFGELSEVSVFLKEAGKESVIPVPKLSVTKDKLPEEQTVVVLE